MENEVMEIDSKIYGEYDLEYPLYCAYELLGETFDITLGKTKGHIVFPKASPVFIAAKENKKLETDEIPGPVCPIDSLTWGNKQDAFGVTDWGQTMSFPDGLTCIKKLFLIFDYEENNLELETQEIFDNIQKWFKKFFEIKEIITKKVSESKKEKVPKLIKGYGACNTGLMLYAYEVNQKKYFPIKNNDMSLKISVNMPHIDLTKEDCGKIVTLVNNSKEIRFDYRFYLEGLRAYNLDDYIKAVTICSPALESALLNGIEKYAKANNIYFFKKLLKKYKMLGGYFSLAEDISMPLPTSTYKTNLLELRNKVIHKGYTPTKEETQKYLDEIRLYLDTFSNGILE